MAMRSAASRRARARWASTRRLLLLAAPVRNVLGKLTPTPAARRAGIARWEIQRKVAAGGAFAVAEYATVRTPADAAKALRALGSHHPPPGSGGTPAGDGAPADAPNKAAATTVVVAPHHGFPRGVRWSAAKGSQSTVALLTAAVADGGATRVHLHACNTAQELGTRAFAAALGASAGFARGMRAQAAARGAARLTFTVSGLMRSIMVGRNVERSDRYITHGCVTNPRGHAHCCAQDGLVRVVVYHWSDADGVTVASNAVLGGGPVHACPVGDGDYE